MREIPLTQGKVALVDDKDYAVLMVHKWYAHRMGKNWYAIRRKPGEDHESMHRRLCDGLNDCISLQVDHIDGNGLNNQRHNLRVATRNQNIRNQSKHRNNMSLYKGVSFVSAGKGGRITDGWAARIAINCKRKYLGTYATAELAAHAYDDAARRLHGEFARLNFQPAEHSL